MMKQELTSLLPVLRRFAYSLTGQMADADDLVQNTIERVLTRTLPEDVDLTKWLFRVCRNIWIDEYRSRKVREKTAQKEAEASPQAFDGEKEVHAEIKVEKVLTAMDSIPDELRSILSLIAIKGFTYQEAAETLKIPVGTVMSRLARARRTIAEKLNINQQGALL